MILWVSWMVYFVCPDFSDIYGEQESQLGLDGVGWSCTSVVGRVVDPGSLSCDGSFLLQVISFPPKLSWPSFLTWWSLDPTEQQERISSNSKERLEVLLASPLSVCCYQSKSHGQGLTQGGEKETPPFEGERVDKYYCLQILTIIAVCHSCEPSELIHSFVDS